MTFADFATVQLPRLRVIARAICADSELADDLVQDVLVKLCSQWPAVSQVPHLNAYVHRMLVNEFLSWRRKLARSVLYADPPEPRPSASSNSEDPVELLAQRAGLINEIRALPPRQRAVIGLRYFADYSDADIAELLGCSQSTVRVHASRALAALRVAPHLQPTVEQDVQ